MEHAASRTAQQQLAEFSPLSSQTQAMGNLEWWMYWRLFGLNSFPYHLTGLVLHAIRTVILFFTGQKLGIGKRGSTLASFCFALHPALFDTISWVSTSTEYTYALIFALLSVLCYIHATPKDETIRWRYVALSVLFNFIGIKSKAQAVFLPGILLGLSVATARSYGNVRNGLAPFLRAGMVPQVFNWGISLALGVLIVVTNAPDQAYKLNFSATNVLQNLGTYTDRAALGYLSLGQSIPSLLILLLGSLFLIPTLLKAPPTILHNWIEIADLRAAGSIGWLVRV